LYEAKRSLHPAVHCFPSSIDKAHFGKARTITTDTDDQKHIRHPRLGFFGVIDERFDIELLDAVSKQRPDWQFIIIGPVVKIDPNSLPRRTNIHYLGPRRYEELPSYLANWDIALLLFARNDATRFISPTKTPEYLAAGKPVISTSIRDVVRPYGQMNLVRIADTPNEFIRAAAEILSSSWTKKAEWLTNVDRFLSEMSWDNTWQQMAELINRTIENRRASETRSLASSAAATTGRAVGLTA
jgi:UDP-galactopyranose mutase